jgi:RNA polymerase sigma-70 factor, ECF subfamily
MITPTQETPDPRAIEPVPTTSAQTRAAEPEAYPPCPAPSRAAFEALYRAHATFVWRSLRRLGVPSAAVDDATQEVFMVVHRRFHDLRPGPTERAWLFAIAQRVASSHRRWVRRKGGLLPLQEELIAGATSPLEGAMRTQASELLLEFLDELDEPRRVAFILAELEQMTGIEAQAASGVNQSTLYARLTSARKAFHAFIARRCVSTREEA